jgi:hypothetical protein
LDATSFPRTIVVSVFSFQCKLLILMLNLIFLLDHDDHDSHFHSFSGSLLPWGPTFGHASVVQPVNLWVCLLMGTTWAMKNIYRISLDLIANCGWILLSGGFLESIHVYKPTYSNINNKHLQAIEIPLSASAGAMRGRHGWRQAWSICWMIPTSWVDCYDFSESWWRSWRHMESWTTAPPY